VAQIDSLRPLANLFDRRIVGDPIAEQALRITAPEGVVFVNHFLGHLRHRLTVDLHDDAEGHEMRIHPIERETLLHVEFMAGVLVEDHLGQQAVDGHAAHTRPSEK
jgi:hypothetical protein